MTQFDKVNKGLKNSSINCYMNVCLQSLIACPAFFNMLTVISENWETSPALGTGRAVLWKFVDLSRYFEPRVQVMQNSDWTTVTDLSEYRKKTVDAQEIFFKEIAEFNPEKIQADCSEFLSIILDKLHEEVKDLYVPNDYVSEKTDEKAK